MSLVVDKRWYDAEKQEMKDSITYHQTTAYRILAKIEAMQAKQHEAAALVVLDAEIKGLCDGISKYTEHCNREMLKDAWNGIDLSAYSEASINVDNFACEHSGRKRVDVASYRPFPHPSNCSLREKSGVDRFMEMKRDEQRASSRKLFLASVREWPRCKVTDTDVALEWNSKGHATLRCLRCYV